MFLMAVETVAFMSTGMPEKGIRQKGKGGVLFN